MKKSIIIYVLVAASLFGGAWRTVEAGYYNPAQAFGKALAFFVAFNLFLALRFGFRALKKFLYRREMKNPKYKEIDSDE